MKKQPVMERLWRKGNPSALLVGMQTLAPTVEHNIEFPPKTKNGIAFDPAIPPLGLYPKNSETPIPKNPCTPMFTAAQFIIEKCWKQPKYPLLNEWIKIHGIVTQWNTKQQKKRRNSYPSQQHGWNWRALC